MRGICSYCDADLGPRPPLDDPSLTHGMCQACYDHFEAQWSGQKLGEYLDRFDTPVVAVEGEGRVVAINRAMARETGVDSREVVGLLGGEFLECVHARMPERCGHTVHCGACTVRNAVEHTLATGEALEQRPAWIQQDARRLDLLISTSLEDGWVRLVIEEKQPAA